jgi:hypothetical protein
LNSVVPSAQTVDFVGGVALQFRVCPVDFVGGVALQFRVCPGAGDFGSADKYQLFIQETAPGGAPVASFAGAAKSVALARAKYCDMLTAQVGGGNAIDAFMQLASATSHTVTVWNVDLRVEIIKR